MSEKRQKARDVEYGSLEVRRKGRARRGKDWVHGQGETNLNGAYMNGTDVEAERERKREIEGVRRKKIEEGGK